ncbi:hypothetical protein [Pseudomonas sp. MGal98]|uniref:hypothetical protein n=1 Tax=Pseudomonas sp. MGal98 TaxID=3162460 RepID=UPI0032ECD64E
MDKIEMNEWCLAFVFGEIRDDNSEQRTVIKILETTCRESVESDKRLVSDYYNSLKLIRSVQANIQNFLEAVVHYADDFLKTQSMDEEKFDAISLNFSRLLLNILSMFRSLIDHSDFSLSRSFGKEAEQYKAWKLSQSEQYDSLFEYRLFYKLRNYCQHVGMPPMSISFSTSASEPGVSLRLDLSRDKLLEEKSSWNSQLISDLMACEEKIPVLDSLMKWGESFRALSNSLLDIKRTSALEAAHRIAGHRERLGLPNDAGQLCIMPHPGNNIDQASLKLMLHWLPEEKAKKLISGKSLFETEANA